MTHRHGSAASLLDDDPLVQVAAAAAALRIDRRNPVAEAILGEAARESDEVAELSRAILTSERQTETRVVEIEYPAGTPDPAADATLVHGTWARRGRWWQQLPSGADLERGLESTTSGGLSRLVGTSQAEARPRPEIGHSYGGSLAMMATRVEKRVRGMVLLSPAVHRTGLPDPANYEQILLVTTKLDLALLADHSKPSLLRSLPNVTERRLRRRGLTGHCATHDPRVWRESGLAEYLRDDWLPLLSPRLYARRASDA